MKPGWTRFWRSASAVLWLGGPGLGAAAAFVAYPASLAQLQGTPNPKNVATADSSVSHGFDELTLAQLRPGRDDLAKAQRVFGKPSAITDSGTALTWRDSCRNQALSIITDSTGMIQEVRVSETHADPKHPCVSAEPSPWITGHGLFLGSSCAEVLALYGHPNSRGPSTKDGQQLELLYYAFDWAGPDVPQLMVVLCTPAKDGKPGRVVELTLDALSL